MARSRVDAVKLVGLVERLLTKRAPVNAGLGASGELSWYCEIERKVSPDFLSLFPIGGRETVAAGGYAMFRSIGMHRKLCAPSKAPRSGLSPGAETGQFALLEDKYGGSLWRCREGV